MSSKAIDGLIKLRKTRKQRAEFEVKQARKKVSVATVRIDDLQLEKYEFERDVPKRQSDYFEAYRLRASENRSLENYRHQMSEITVERASIKQTITVALEQLEEAEAAMKASRELLCRAERNERKLDSFKSHFDTLRQEETKRAENNETDEWLSTTILGAFGR